MRIALVSEHASPLAAVGEADVGGQNVHVAALAAGLVRAGHDVIVYTRRDDPALADHRWTPAGYGLVHLDAGPAAHVARDDLWPHMPAFASELRRWLLVQQPDVVHAHFWMSAWAAAYAIGEAATPLAVTFHALGTVKRRHQGAADTSPAERQLIEPGVGERADVVIATCRDEVAELTAMGLDPARIEVVPCGVDVDLFHPRGVTRAPDPDGRRRVVTVGRLVPRKGFDALLAALAELPHTELVIAGGPPAIALGEDPEHRRLQAVAAGRGVADRVRFVGQVPRRAMPALLRSADVVACTPWYEPFGLVPLEAMACGRPVVATAVGGMTDTVRHGTSGVLVPPADHGALVEALRALLDEPGRAAALGRHGRRLAEREYAWPAVVAATTRVYRSLRQAPVRAAAS